VKLLKVAELLVALSGWQWSSRVARWQQFSSPFHAIACGGGAVMHGRRCHQAAAAVAMLAVVPAEELLAVGASILDELKRAPPIRGNCGGRTND
jgi:hypothetical protein